MVLRAAVIGLGKMGKHHARVLSDLDGVDFVGVYDPELSSSSSLNFHAYPTLGDLLSEDLDYCVVAVPTARHLEVGLKLAEFGVHALIEKPLGPTIAEAKQLRDAYEGAGLTAAVGHIERFNPAVREARRRIQAGDLGEVLQISTKRLGPFPGRISDVGVIMDLATHDIDLTMSLGGSTFASLSTYASKRSGGANEDAVSASGILANGVLTNHLVNWLSPVKEREVTITGGHGAFRIDTLSADLTFFRNGSIASQWAALAQFRGVSEGDVIRFAFPKPEPLVLEHQNFRDLLLGRTAENISLNEGLSVVETAEAMLQSTNSIKSPTYRFS